MDILVPQPGRGDGLYSLCLRNLLRIEALAFKHVEEVGIAAGVDLIGAFQLYTAFPEQVGEHAVNNGRAQLRLDVIADDRDARASEPVGPPGIAGDEDRDVVDESDPCLQRAFGVEFGCLLRADRQVIHHHLGAGFTQGGDHRSLVRLWRISLPECAFIGVGVHMLGNPVEHAAHLDPRSCRINFFAEPGGAVGRRKDRLCHIAADLAPVDIPGGHDPDIAGQIAAYLMMHQPGRVVRAFAIMGDALYQRTGAIADAD